MSCIVLVFLSICSLDAPHRRPLSWLFRVILERHPRVEAELAESDNQNEECLHLHAIGVHEFHRQRIDLENGKEELSIGAWETVAVGKSDFF